MPLGLGGLGMGMMGLGLAGDVFGALSAYNQANRQREQYEYAKQFQNPAWVLSQSQPYINRLNKVLAGQTQNIMRSQVNPMIGSRGIDPSSGAGQSIYAQALAPYIVNNQYEGMNQFLRGAGQGQQYGSQNIGPTYGSTNGLQRTLQMLYMRNAGGGAVPTGTATTTPYAGDSGLEGLSNWRAVPPSAGSTSWSNMFLPGTGAGNMPASYYGDYGTLG